MEVVLKLLGKGVLACGRSGSKGGFALWEIVTIFLQDPLDFFLINICLKRSQRKSGWKFSVPGPAGKFPEKDL